MTTAADGAPLLTVSGIAAGYGDLRAVWDVSLKVWPGQLTALLGRNGAGKTTTLRAISGLNKVQSGTVRLREQDITRVPPYQRVRMGMAYVQEGKRVFRRLTVEQNLILGGYVRKQGRANLRKEAERVYELFPVLGEKRRLPAGSMSGGQQQMLAIGQALMAEPSVLLLDEPSGGLAPVIVAEVMDRIGALRGQGLGILLVEQAVEAAIGYADHVAVLDVGKVVLTAKAGEVDDMTILRDAYFGKQASSAQRPSEP
ncbi:ABC transporter ATP-binding protein [Trebonia kvetii]|uniref:ABC transporter ATP-binding protein n=1 Tax=Trebonia kvetii TaxID=2480626 RepID=UPI001C9E58B8|nr:ABC transporter ATP-binding protein [Trebonia kvetii]